MTMEQDVTLSVVESDKPTQVRMYNGLGCEIGLWLFEEWCREMARGDIIIQVGDRFDME
jgi:hypothetical protein